MPSKEENAYFAGMLDGEGSIEIGYEKGIGKCRNHHPIVTITNSHEGVCQRAKELYGGCVYKRQDKWHKAIEVKGYKPCFSWIVPSRKAEAFLKLVLPFLIIKREQAELALTFYEGFIHLNDKLSRQTELSRRDDLREQIKKLHRRKIN